MYNKKMLSWFGKLFTILLCLCFGFYVFINANKINSYVQRYAFPVIADVLYHISDVEELNRILFDVIGRNEHVSSIIVYKFVPDEETAMYKGQTILSAKSRYADESIIPDGTIESINTREYIQNILMNKIQYDNTETIKVLCENLFELQRVYSCDNFKTIGLRHRSIVSIPVMDMDTFAVIGYLTVTMDSTYSNHDIKILVNSIKKDLSRIEKILKYHL